VIYSPSTDYNNVHCAYSSITDQIRSCRQRQLQQRFYCKYPCRAYRIAASTGV